MIGDDCTSRRVHAERMNMPDKGVLRVCKDCYTVIQHQYVEDLQNKYVSILQSPTKEDATRIGWEQGEHTVLEC